MQTNKPLKKQDKKEINDSLDSANRGEPVDTSMVQAEPDETADKLPGKNTSLSVPGGGINIEGLQDVPASVIPVPFVRVVQGQSKKIDLATGGEAPEGSFYFNDIQEAFETLSFIMLRAKQQTVEFEREENGQMVKKPTKQILILGITTDTKKLFILTLSISSFSNFGRLVNRFKENKITRTWEYEIVASAEKQENDKGKFWVQKYDLGDKLNSKTIDEMAEVYGEHGGVLDRDYTQNETEGVE